MKKKLFAVAAGLLCAALLLLWFCGFLPEKAAIKAAEKYMENQLYGEFYKAEYAEYSPAHDSYFVYFSGGPNPSGEMGTTRHIGVYYRWLPFFVWYDSINPG
ncbi:MAG: hypothetical protein IKJ82_02565 [Oscillospiraceae bacterium]|nr:hypothetical protein [Oscillospiraceae bacterium]